MRCSSVDGADEAFATASTGTTSRLKRERIVRGLAASVSLFGFQSWLAECWRCNSSCS